MAAFEALTLIKTLTSPQSPLSCIRVAFEIFLNFEYKSSFSLKKIIFPFNFSEKRINFQENATKCSNNAQCFCLTKMLEKMLASCTKAFKFLLVISMLIQSLRS